MGRESQSGNKRGGAPPDVLRPILQSDLPPPRKLELAILYRAYLDTHITEGYITTQEYKIQEAIEWLRSENGKAICEDFGVDPESLIGGIGMGKPEPIDMKTLLDQQVKLAVSMERLEETIGPLMDAIRRGTTYDLIVNRRVDILANNPVEIWAGKDAEVIAIRSDTAVDSTNFTYYINGRPFTAMSTAYKTKAIVPDEILIPLPQRGAKIDFMTDKTGVITFSGLTITQSIPRLMTQLLILL